MNGPTPEQLNALLRDWLGAANSLLAKEGWHPFGFHAGLISVPPLEFSEELSEDGLPYYERRIGA